MGDAEVRVAAQSEAMLAIHDIAESYRRGQVSYRTASAQIEEILSADACRVVHVGRRTHTPEVES